MQAIIEGYIVNFTEIGFGCFIVNIASIILTATLDASFFAGQVEGANQIHMMISQLEDLEYLAEFLFGVNDHLRFEDLFRGN